MSSNPVWTAKKARWLGDAPEGASILMDGLPRTYVLGYICSALSGWHIG